MNVALWLPVLARFTAVLLAGQGKVKEAEYLNDLTTAATRGIAVDDLLEQAAKDWAENGEPTFDDIEAKRKVLQERILGPSG